MTTRDNEVRAIFANNLAQLIENKTTITELSRATGINRTQIGRFLAQESFPRPDILARICEYFQCDARILTVSLREIEAAQASAGPFVLHTLKSAFRPAPQEILQNGYYQEWRIMNGNVQLYVKSLMQVKTICNVRMTKMICADRILGAESRVPPIKRMYEGQAIMQSAGVTIFDRGRHNLGLWMKRLSFGYQGDERYFPGWEVRPIAMGGMPEVPVAPIVLRRIDVSTRGDLRREQAIGQVPLGDVPMVVRQILAELSDALPAAARPAEAL